MSVAPRSFKTEEIVSQWQQRFGIDVARLFEGVAQIELRHDHDTGLQFFDPPIAGDAPLYEALQRYPWYYLEDKWEYERALAGIQTPCRLLEVGCGCGVFLRKAAAAGHIGVGLELSEAAAAAARAEGLDVRSELLDAFLAHDRSGFDRVYSFQVLEHEVDPVGLLRQMMSVVRPGGRVCFAVPNRGSFISRTENILDMPPHRVSRWSPAAIRLVGTLIGAFSVIVEEGPLEPVHFEWYCSVQLGRLQCGRVLNNRVARRGLSVLLRAGLAHRIRGHSLYAEYVR